jgi:co-chaperonin GroES (HSP10)
MERKISEDALVEAFPAVDAGVRPFGSRVLVQIRSPIKKTKGGIHIIEDIRDTEKWNTQVAKVISLGPLAFKNRTTMEPWPEGAWCKPGDFIRVAKYGGDRWEVVFGDDGEKAMFVIFNDLDVLGDVTGNPLVVKAFI